MSGMHNVGRISIKTVDFLFFSFQETITRFGV